MAFAVIGDTVNTASRLQAIAKDLKTALIASEALVAAVKSETGIGSPLLERLVPAGEVHLRGRSQPVRVFKTHENHDDGVAITERKMEAQPCP